MKLRALFMLILIFALLSCKQEHAVGPLWSASSPTIVPVLDPITVKVRFTGVAHLVGDNGATKRLLVIPNFRNLLFTPEHRLLLLATDRYAPELLTEEDTQSGTGIKYHFRTLPDGYELDLDKSGILRGTPLVPDETGDSTYEECPDPVKAPKTSLHWLPRLSTMSRASNVKVKGSHIGRDPDFKDVLMRVDIDDGTLAAALRVRPGKFEFNLDNIAENDRIQAVASTLDYSFTALVPRGKPFVLIGRKFKQKQNDPETWTELGRFMPYGGNVEVILANVVPKHFFNPTIANDIPHFKHYYGILETTIKQAKPVRLANPCPTGGAESGVECGPDRVP